MMLKVASAFLGSALCRSQLEGGGCAVIEPREPKRSAQPVALLPITNILEATVSGWTP